MCTDRARQPLPLAATAAERLRVMERDSAAIERAVTEASTLVASCTTRAAANQARQLYAGARTNLDDLARAGDDARADLRDALAFFGGLRLARTSMVDAARRIAALEGHLATALTARAGVREASPAYAVERAAHDGAMTAVLVSVWNLQRALPGVLPKHIGDGFKEIDAAVTAEIRSVFAGSCLAAEPNWGLASNYACRGMPDGTPYDSGTITWDLGSCFDRSNVYRTARESTMVLCAARASATAARGNFRDSNQAHGPFIQWNGTSGSITTESVEGPDSGQTFTVTRP